MAELVPAIHELTLLRKKARMPVTSAGMTNSYGGCHGESKAQSKGNQNERQKEKAGEAHFGREPRQTAAAEIHRQPPSRRRFRPRPAGLFRLSRSWNRIGDKRHGAGACHPHDQAVHPRRSRYPALSRRRFPDGVRAHGLVPERVRGRGRAHFPRRLLLDSAAEDQAYRARLFRRLRASRDRAAGGLQDGDAGLEIPTKPGERSNRNTAPNPVGNEQSIQRRTPNPCMKRARICTGSRSVVPTPGLSSMRAAIRLGPPSLSAAANSRSNSSSSAAHALFPMPAPAAIATRSAVPALAVSCPPVI